MLNLPVTAQLVGLPLLNTRPKRAQFTAVFGGFRPSLVATRRSFGAGGRLQRLSNVSGVMKKTTNGTDAAKWSMAKKRFVQLTSDGGPVVVDLGV